MTHAIPIEQFNAWIGKLVQKVENPDVAPSFKTWMEEFAQNIAEGFQGSHSQFGQTWPPLKHPRPKGHNQDPHPLIDTGALMASVTSDAGDSIREITVGHGESTLTFGTSIAYGIFHQTGTSRVPARPFLNVNQDQADRAAELFAQTIIRTFAA